MLADLRVSLNRFIGRRNTALQVYKTGKVALEDQEGLVLAVQEAQGYLQQIAEQVQQGPHKQIAKVVSKCLSAVFQAPYELRIELEQRRGRTEVDFVYLRNGRKAGPRVDSGGVLHIASLALRIASLVITLPAVRRFLALDEIFSSLSRTNLAKIGVLLESLATELDMQMLIVTHSEELQIGRVISLD
jgi:DNA repair exonuclease SbcCD ATPase subunit